MIEVSHLTKQYGNHLAVDDVSFTVADGQICGLLGPNGAGKSTIMNILTGYLSATSGQVTVAGHPLPEEADAAKACVGYLPEQPPLYPEMTVAEYLDFAAELKGVKKADRPAQVQSAARRTGLEDVRQSDPQNDGDGGDHLEVNNGFRANTPELFGITNTRDTHHQRGDHNRHNNHFDQMDEDITRRREQIDDQPVAAVAMVVQVASQENAQHHSKQNLPGQAEFYIFHMNDFLNGAPFPVQKRENVTYCQGMNCVALVCRFF